MPMPKSSTPALFEAITNSLTPKTCIAPTDGRDNGKIVATEIGDTISYHGGENGKPFGTRPGGGQANGVQITWGADGYFQLSGIATGNYEFDIEFWLPASSSYNKGVQVQIVKLSSELDPSAKTGEGGVGGATNTRDLAVFSVTESIPDHFLYPHSASNRARMACQIGGVGCSREATPLANKPIRIFERDTGRCHTYSDSAFNSAFRYHDT